MHCFFRIAGPAPILLFSALAVFLFQPPATGQVSLDSIPGLGTAASDTAPIVLAQPSPSEDLYLADFEFDRLAKLSGRVAFAADIEGRSRIYVLDLDARRVHRLIDGPGDNSYPAWSPDGTRLTFTSDRDGNKEIYLTDWEGLGLTRLTRNNVTDDNASWAPDGQQIVYYSDTGSPPRGTNTDLFMLRLSEGTSRRITSFGDRNTTPQISPNGTSIAYSTNRFWPGWDVCLWNLSAASENCLLQSRIESFCRPAWSPSGQELAYSGGIGDAVDLSVIKFSDRSKTTATSLAMREYDATWAPSGKHIIFAAENGEKEQFNLYLLDLADKEVTPFIRSRHALRYPSWSAVTTLQLEARRVANSNQIEAMTTALPQSPQTSFGPTQGIAPGTSAAAMAPVFTIPPPPPHTGLK